MLTTRSAAVLLVLGLGLAGCNPQREPVPESSIAPPPSDTGAGLLFHASFDNDRRAEVAGGDDRPYIVRHASLYRDDGNVNLGERVDGVFGKALTGKNAFGWYDTRGNFLPQRGTIAFHIRQTGKHYSFDPFNIRTVDPYYWHRYIRLESHPDSLTLSIADQSYQTASINSGAGRGLQSGKWHHVAIVWDQAHGSRLYLDGEEAASNWGQATWVSPGVDGHYLWTVNDDDVAYDELYVFDRPLTAAQIRRLATGNVPPTPQELSEIDFDDAAIANRLMELSWDEPDPAMPLAKVGRTGLGVNAVQQVLPKQARAVKKEANAAFDGKLGWGWPPIYNYDFNGGNGLHVRVDEPFDYVAIEGHFAGRVRGDHPLIDDGGPALATFDGRAFMQRWRLGDTASPAWLSFFRQTSDTVRTSRVVELGLFRVGTHDLNAAASQTLYLGPAAVGESPDPTLGPGDRAALSVSQTAPTSTSGQAIPGLRYHTIILPTAKDTTALLGLRLSLWLAGSLTDNAVRVEVFDALTPNRRLVAIDFALDADDVSANRPQPLDLTLDLADRVIPAGKSIRVRLIFKRDVDLVWGPQMPSAVHVLKGNITDVLPQFVESELNFAHSRFRELSEPRPWVGQLEPEKTLPPINRWAGELFDTLTLLRNLGVEDSRLTALWRWTHKHEVVTTPVDVEDIAGAPRWALLQRELLRRCRDVLYWWIDNRQTPNGEFGDDWSDDSDLLQNFPKLAMISDPGDRLRSAAHLYADGLAQTGRIKRGINANTTDYLHAYEEGVNVPPVMALLGPGDPRPIEQMMEAARTVEEHLTALDAQGRRRFRSSTYGADQVQDQGDYGVDGPGNALFCHPALMLGYFSRHPRAVSFVTQWLDGWLSYFSDAEAAGQKYPVNTLMDGTVTRRDTRVLGFGFVDAWAGAFAMTGDSRYAQTRWFWTGPVPPKLGNEMAGLELVDWSEHRDALIASARRADLSRPLVDMFSRTARQHYLLFEAGGDEQAAIDALEACLRNIQSLFDAYTWGEPINDRIWLPDHPAVVMALGEMPHERNQVWPRHYVTWHGFDDHAAWVREKSDTELLIWVYNFSAEPAAGMLRTWRTPLGTYSVSLKAGDVVLQSHEHTLYPGAAIHLTLPPRQTCVLEIRQLEASNEDFWQRPDAAISSADVSWSAERELQVVVHNLGNAPLSDLNVALVDAEGRVLAEQRLAHLEAPLDLIPRTATVTFSTVHPAAVQVRLDLSDSLAELDELNNAAPIPAR